MLITRFVIAVILEWVALHGLKHQRAGEQQQERQRHKKVSTMLCQKKVSSRAAEGMHTEPVS